MSQKQSAVNKQLEAVIDPLNAQVQSFAEREKALTEAVTEEPKTGTAKTAKANA